MTDSAEPMLPHLLSREMLSSGRLEAMVARAMPSVRLLTPAERDASLHATLAAHPEPGDAVWLFGYGSLIWNPTVHVAEERRAHVAGWHRAFCLTASAGRGTAACPGLLLGLLRGGACSGMALRVAPEAVVDELALLWRREMLANSYVPAWVEVAGDDGARFGHAIAFTINPDSAQFAGNLHEDEVVRRLATASGELGSCAEYLFRTCDGLRALGLTDPAIEHLAARVRRRMDAEMDQPSPLPL